MGEHHAYLQVMLELAATGADVRRRAQQQPAPPAGRDGRGRWTIPMVTTLHTPPTPWLESAIRSGDRAAHVRRRQRAHRRGVGARRPTRASSTTASTSTAGARARAGPGRLVGPPRAGEGAAPGHRRRRAGRRPDRARRPGRRPGLLRRRDRARGSGPACAYVGHLDQRRAGRLAGRAPRVALVTPAGTSPTAWSPPRRWPAAPRSPPSPAAGCPRSSDDDCGALVAPGDVAGLADAIRRARRAARDRRPRRTPCEHCSRRPDGRRATCALYDARPERPVAA